MARFRRAVRWPLAAFRCLIVIARAGISPRVAPILFFPLLADALLTLLDGARRGPSLDY